MTARTVEQIVRAAWTAVRLVDETGVPLRGEAAVAYVRRCVETGGPDADFFGVLVETCEGTRDVCHTGNGPHSHAHAAFIAEAGSVAHETKKSPRELVAARDELRRRLETAETLLETCRDALAREGWEEGPSSAEAAEAVTSYLSERALERDIEKAQAEGRR